MTPKERCWELRNYFGTLTGRYDKADECGVKVCEYLLPYMPKDKMIDINDDDCTEYWERVKNHLIAGD